MNALSFYAALLALLYVFLSIRTVRLRRQLKIDIGDGGNAHMLRAMRVHTNFAEYVPLALLLLFMAQGQGAPISLIHGLGGCLVIGRFVHAYGVSQVKENFRLRTIGMLLTFAALICTSLYLLSATARPWLA